MSQDAHRPPTDYLAGREMHESLTRVALTASVQGMGVAFGPGDSLPCFPRAQLSVLHGRPNTLHHLLTGLYLLSRTGGAVERAEVDPVSLTLGRAGFPFPWPAGAPPPEFALQLVGRFWVGLYLANIATARTEIIVNAANEGLWMGGGVAGALRSRGGIELEQVARQKAPAPMGGVVRTQAGKLPALEIFHAVVIDQIHMTRSEQSAVDASFRKVLEIGLDEGISSVAVPFLGCGVGGLSIEEVTRTYLAACRTVSHERKHRGNLFVALCVIEEEEAQRALSVFKEEQDPGAMERMAEDYLREAQRQLAGNPDLTPRLDDDKS